MGGKFRLFLSISTAFCAVFLVVLSVQAVGNIDGVEMNQAKRQSELNLYDYVSEDDVKGYLKDDSWLTFDSGFEGGASIALADLGGDGVKEIVVGAGPGGGPDVRIFRSDGSYINSFYAYSETFDKGVNVAAGDLDGDGKDEIVVGPGQGGGPHIRIFDGYGQPKFNLGFFAYSYDYRGGVNVALGDVNGDGLDEIITGPGINSGPQVRVFNRDGLYLGLDFWPFGENDRGGVSVAAGNFDGGDDDEIVMGLRSQGEAWIKVYKFSEQKEILGEFRAWPQEYRGGVNLSAGDVDDDGADEIVAAVHGSGGPQVRFFNADGTEAMPNFFAYEEDFRGGVNVAVGNLDNDDKQELITTPTILPPSGRTDLEKYVYVNLTEQRLYAYEHGYLANSFLISSGLPQTPTPPGEYNIIRKMYSHLYAGPDYYLPNTLYNMEFRRGYYLHGAYWHNNFGHPMSHGCINIEYSDAAWIYDWIDVGTTVIIGY